MTSTYLTLPSPRNKPQFSGKKRGNYQRVWRATAKMNKQGVKASQGRDSKAEIRFTYLLSAWHGQGAETANCPRETWQGHQGLRSQGHHLEGKGRSQSGRDGAAEGEGWECQAGLIHPPPRPADVNMAKSCPALTPIPCPSPPPPVAFLFLPPSSPTWGAHPKSLSKWRTPQNRDYTKDNVIEA